MLVSLVCRVNLLTLRPFLFTILLFSLVSVAKIAFTSDRSKEWTEFPETAVVFSGQFNRIEKALELLENGEIRQLLVSGVTAGSGVSYSKFEQQFRLTNTVKQAWVDGELVLGVRATTTLENGAETACWIAENNNVDELLLITSSRHMERAAYVLSRALPGVTILELEVTNPPSSHPRRDDLWEHAAKHVTYLLKYLPSWLFVQLELANCTGAIFR